MPKQDKLVVFFTASYYGKQKYQANYDLVRRSIEEFYVDLISPEVGNYQEVLDEATRQRITDPKLLHYETIRQGIHVADAVIIEISHEDFQLGHEATLAIMEKKPVLCLSVHEDFSQKIHNNYFFGAKYTLESIKPVIQDFLAHARDMRLSQRFNLFLYPQQLEYLEKAAKRFGLNKSEYIRRLISHDHKLHK